MKLPSPIHRRHSRIEIIPLIDIMFFLLASFMMVSLQLEHTQNIKVNLPPASQGKPDFKPDMINLAVDRSGAVWLEKKQISLPELTLVISNRFHQDTNTLVYIGADANAQEGALAPLYDVVRQAGVQKIALTVSAEAAAPGGPKP